MASITIAMVICLATSPSAARISTASAAAFHQPIASRRHGRCSPRPRHRYGYVRENFHHQQQNVNVRRFGFARTRLGGAEGDLPESFTYTRLEGGRSGGGDGAQGSGCGHDLEKVLRVMERAAYSAGRVALSTAGRIAVKTTKANARDLVTESDVECQRLIQQIISEEFPDDVFLGEEDVDLSGEDGGGASSEALRKALGIAGGGVGEEKERLLFVVDPIDGTTNFQAGLPIYAMSIGAVLLAGSTPEVVAGVVYNPTMGEMTSAVRGRGCYLNNIRINPKSNQHIDTGDRERQAPSQSVLSQSLINVGFPVARESTLAASSRAVAALATRVRGLRMVACASQAMAWVAQSRMGSYFSWDLNAWDVAAGMVIVEESGGLVSNFDGTRAGISSRDMIITCPPEIGEERGALRDELIQVLEENDCLRYD